MINPLNYFITKKDITTRTKTAKWLLKVLQADYTSDKKLFKEVVPRLQHFIFKNQKELKLLDEDKLNEAIYEEVSIIKREFPQFFSDSLGWYSRKLLVDGFKKGEFSYKGLFYKDFIEQFTLSDEEKERLDGIIAQRKEEKEKALIEYEKKLEETRLENERIAKERLEKRLASRIPLEVGQVFKTRKALLSILEELPVFVDNGVVGITNKLIEVSKEYFLFEKLKTNYVVTAVIKDILVYPDLIVLPKGKAYEKENNI